MLTRAAVFALIVAGCAGPQFHQLSPVPAEVRVDRIELTWSNVYLLTKGDAALLIDSGSPQDRDALAAALAARGVNIRAVVITHAHADHAGLARWLQQRGAQVVLGAADAPNAARGKNDPLPATSLLGGWLAPLFMFSYEPFTPDVAVDHEIDLGAYGFPELHVVPTPGHTPGSLAVVMGTDAFAGDLFKGGRFAKYWVDTPSEHYYQADAAADHRAIAALLERGVTRFYIGHGGPVTADAVKAWLPHADDHGPPEVAELELAAHGEIPRRDGHDALSGVLRARFGVARPVGYYGGVDLRAGDLGGGYFEADLHALGLALRNRDGALLAVTGGLGIGGVRGIGALSVPIELSAELPAGPVRLIGRAGLAWRVRGDDYAATAHGLADEATALIGVRLGRDHHWGSPVVAGLGPFVALTYRDLGGAELFGLMLGFDMFAGD